MITQCRSCYSRNLKDILSLGDIYLSDFTSPLDPKPPKYPLRLVLCKDCTLLQLRETTPPTELYTSRYGYRSGINNTIKADLKEIAQKALTYVELKENDIWLSIGENDGTLLSFVPKRAIKVGVEPITKLAEACKEHADIVINDFWDYETYQKEVTEEKLSNVRERNTT